MTNPIRTLFGVSATLAALLVLLFPGLEPGTESRAIATITLGMLLCMLLVFGVCLRNDWEPL